MSRKLSVTTLRTPSRVALGFAAALLTLASAAAQAPVYHAEFLGAATQASALNDSGLVVGTGTILNKYPRAFVAGPGKPLTFLPLPLGFLSSGATDINDAGVIVGVMSPYQTTAFYPQPVRWDPNGSGGWTPTLLATLPGDNRGTADAINNLGDILGTSAFQGNMHVVLYAPTGTVDLPAFAGLLPQSINDQRQFVGAGAWRADLDTFAVQNLGVPAGYASAHGWVINASGQVAGDLGLSGTPGCTQQAALFTDGAGWQNVGPCGTSNSGYDLDDAGDLLYTRDGVPYVRFAAGGDYRVEDLIVAAAGHWTVNSPIDIALNNARQMALYATNGSQSGILLITPDTGLTCQADIGFAGPGAMQLSLCGGDLSTGTTATLGLFASKPDGIAWLVTGVTQQPTPFKGGTLVPMPWALILALPVDATAHASIPGVPGGQGPFSVYLQALQADAGQLHGWAISNALRADFLP